MRGSRDCTGSGPTSDPPCWSAPIYKIHPSLELRSYRYMATGSDMSTTPSDAWNELGKSRFLRHGRPISRPTSLMVYLTQESLQTPKPTPDWTDNSPTSLKTTVYITLLSNKKRPPPLVFSTPSWLQWPQPTTPKPVRSPTWSHWASTSASGCVNTPSAPATDKQSNYGPSWTSFSLLGINSS